MIVNNSSNINITITSHLKSLNTKKLTMNNYLSRQIIEHKYTTKWTTTSHFTHRTPPPKKNPKKTKKTTTSHLKSLTTPPPQKKIQKTQHQMYPDYLCPQIIEHKKRPEHMQMEILSYTMYIIDKRTTLII